MLRPLSEAVKKAKELKEKKERDEKSRNPNPKTPKMMGERNEDRLTERDKNFLKEKLESIKEKSPNRRFKNVDPDRDFLKKGKTFQKLSKGGLKGNQKKLDKNNNNRIDAQDFKILKAEKAKGRGMGLQDEKVQPGKVMKAKRGDFMKRRMQLAKGFGKTIGVFPKIQKQTMGEAKDYKNYLKGLKQATMSSKAKKAGEAAAKVAKSTRLGKIALGVAGAGIAAKKFIESDKFKDMLKKKMNKKMGGGMIGASQMPKYSKGTMIMARGCKLGRKKATKIT